jgi:hypothetical protein
VLGEIARHYADGFAPGTSPLGNLPQLIANLTGSQVQDAAKTYLGSDYVKVTLMPAK